MSYHIPVLLKEAVDGLNVQSGKKYIDATLGGGGHSLEILKRGGIVLGIDQDESAIDFVNENNEERIKNKELRVVRGNFSDIKTLAKENGFEKVSGVLFDLGVSSYQIDESGRGFSFRREEPLDMRMDSGSELRALDVVNNWKEEDLTEIFSKYGEEVKAAEIATAIVESRKERRIETSLELAKIVSDTVKISGPTHPATRIFQAIRIAVNDEMGRLRLGLSEAFDLIEKEGRISVISFHSLEDRITKLYFLKLVQAGQAAIINKKPIIADIVETGKNRRSRSAKLRIIKKI